MNRTGETWRESFQIQKKQMNKNLSDFTREQIMARDFQMTKPQVKESLELIRYLLETEEGEVIDVNSYEEAMYHIEQLI